MISICLAVILDFILGDPYSFPHPVKLMGNIISFEERIARKIDNGRGVLKLLGFIIVVINILIGFFLPYYLLKALERYKTIHTIVNICLIYTCLAARSLHYEAMKVKEALPIGIEEARHRVSYIVGRETDNLKEDEIIKATIETVAENTADGLIVPLFFIFLLGAPGGLAYKFINTMDSMLGYMDEKYRDIGYFPAIIDDLFNYIPARITSILMILSSVGRFNVKEGKRITIRDRKNHKSPNAGYPESTVAGLLGIQLGGDNFYHGVLIKKPTIGDRINEVNSNHIKDTIEIMYRSEILLLFIYIIIFIIRKRLW
ncbi:MAG TPA: adenosylcobinamide-phosphate synthase CbiB [Tissierellaceae bacterium]|nr:adenosylcobinamide-phosphate synthase CbiB [Tissierellaceae bacterium]